MSGRCSCQSRRSLGHEGCFCRRFQSARHSPMPGTIRGARNSEYGWTSKHRIVKPRTTRSTTLGRCSNSAEDSNGWVDLIWHLTTTASEQGWRSILDNIERYPTHDAHHTADLEATEDFARQTFLGPSLTLAKRQVIDQIALEIVRPVIAGRAAV